jgi:hypothetical protein
MHKKNSRHNASPRRHRQEITFKVHIGGWVVVRKNARGATFRVRWTVAGKPRSRTFRSEDRAQAFRQRLIQAARQGQPFEVASGLPLSIAVGAPCPARIKRQRGRHA